MGYELPGVFRLQPWVKSATWAEAPQDTRLPFGVLDGYRGWDRQAQFPALWSPDPEVHNSMVAEPDAWLVPRSGKDHEPIWSQAGTLQIAPSI